MVFPHQRARIFHVFPLLETPNPDPGNSMVLLSVIKSHVPFVAGRGRDLRAGRREAGGGEARQGCEARQVLERDE